MMRGLQKAQENREMVAFLYHSRGRRAVSEFLGIPYDSTGHVLKKQGFYEEKEEHNKLVRERVLCRNPFIEWNDVSAYLFGYALGDGSIVWNKTKWYMFYDSSERQVIDEMSKVFGLPVTKPDYRVQICDQAVCRKLLEWGLRQNKSVEGCDVNIPSGYRNAVVRGLQDSDGSVVRHNGGTTVAVVLYGHASYLDKIVAETPFVWKEGWQEGLRRRALYRQEELVKYYDWLYEGASIFLKRKKEILDEYFIRG